MKRYDEYIEEDIEELVRQCHRLAEQVILQADQVNHLSERLRDRRHSEATPQKEREEIAPESDLPF
jgi:uncharacterized coiled-coil protein SlyX